jgi:flavin-dependent dehydrogenase
VTASVRHAHYDVVIAGARCAGAATAMLLARAGLRVLVVDPLPRGRDALSTHALMRGAVLQLSRWGLLDDLIATGTPAITRTTFDYGDEVVPIAIESKHGVAALYAPRRTVLDPLLEDAAVRAGAEVVRGLRVAELVRRGDGAVVGVWLQGRDRSVRVSCDLVVGADGMRSDVARLAGAPTERVARHTTATVYGYFRGLPDEGYRWYFRPGLGAGVIPTHEGAACVCVNVPPQRIRVAGGRDALDRLHHETLRAIDPGLAERLRPERRLGGLRAFAGEPGFLRRAAGPGWALVGDAGYFRDPLTAHGITDALRDAELLARAVVRGGAQALRAYQEARDRVSVGLLEVTDAIASLDWSIAEVKALHRRLNREMNAGLELLSALDGVEAPSEAPLAPPAADPRRSAEHTAEPESHTVVGIELRDRYAGRVAHR